MIALRVVRAADKFHSRPLVSNVGDALPERDPGFDCICSEILERTPFVFEPHQIAEGVS